MTEPTPLDLLWIAMWDDLRHNATGNPSGLAIVARYRPQIESAIRSRDDAEPLTVGTPLDLLDEREGRPSLDVIQLKTAMRDVLDTTTRERVLPYAEKIVDAYERLPR